MNERGGESVAASAKTGLKLLPGSRLAFRLCPLGDLTPEGILGPCLGGRGLEAEAERVERGPASGVDLVLARGMEDGGRVEEEATTGSCNSCEGC